MQYNVRAWQAFGLGCIGWNVAMIEIKMHSAMGAAAALGGFYLFTPFFPANCYNDVLECLYVAFGIKNCEGGSI